MATWIYDRRCLCMYIDGRHKVPPAPPPPPRPCANPTPSPQRAVYACIARSCPPRFGGGVRFFQWSELLLCMSVAGTHCDTPGLAVTPQPNLHRECKTGHRQSRWPSGRACDDGSSADVLQAGEPAAHSSGSSSSRSSGGDESTSSSSDSDAAKLAEFWQIVPRTRSGRILY